MASPADTPAPVGDAARERRRRAAALGPLEAVWRRERRGRSRVFGPFYRSGFLRAFLAGRLEDGAELGVACGTHSRYYPYFHHRSRWDDLLLVAGEERLRVTARNLSTLSISLGPGRRGSIAFHGLAFRRSGASVDVDLHLELEVTLLPPRVEGLGYRFAVAGLQWHPALVHGSGSLTLRGLPVGRYFLKETQAPNGYVLSTAVHLIEISKDIAGKIILTVDGTVNAAKTLTAVNHPAGTVIVRKLAGDTAAAQPGAVLEQRPLRRGRRPT